MQILIFLFPIACFLFLVFLNLQSLSAFLLLRRLRKENNLAYGTVTDWEPKWYGYSTPIISFKDKDGIEIEGVAQNLKTISNNGFGFNWEVGSEVKVYYSGSDASFFIVNVTFQVITIPALLVVTSLLILYIVVNAIMSLF